MSSEMSSLMIVSKMFFDKLKIIYDYCDTLKSAEQAYLYTLMCVEYAPGNFIDTPAMVRLKAAETKTKAYADADQVFDRAFQNIGSDDSEVSYTFNSLEYDFFLSGEGLNDAKKTEDYEVIHHSMCYNYEIEEEIFIARSCKELPPSFLKRLQDARDLVDNDFYNKGLEINKKMFAENKPQSVFFRNFK